MDLKRLVALQFAVIIILAFFLIKLNLDDNESITAGLLSPRVYSGILKPQSYLIFNFEPLENDIGIYIKNRGINSSVYVLNIRDGASMGINQEYDFEPASLNKLPIAILTMKKIENGEYSLDTEFSINDYDKDGRSGSLFNRTDNELSVKDLLYYMLKESDNTAFRVLSERISLKDLQSLSEYLNFYSDNLIYDPKLKNNNIYEITPESTSRLFLSLYLSTILEPEHSEMLLSMLTNTSYDINKYARLPNDVIVAQKYGSYYVNDSRYFHSCGIMYIKDSRILYCIMTEGLAKDEGEKEIGNIVNKIYTYVVSSRKSFDKQPPL